MLPVQQGHFWLQGHSFNKLSRGPLNNMLHTKYQGSRPCWFRQYFFHVFPIKIYVKHVIPRVGPFLAPGAYFEQTW